MAQNGYGGGGWSGKRSHNGGSSNETPKRARGYYTHPYGQYGNNQPKGTKLAIEKGGVLTNESTRPQKVKPYAKFAVNANSDLRVGYYNGEKCVRLSNGIDIYTNRNPLTEFCYNDHALGENINNSCSIISKSIGSDTVFLTVANFEKLLEVFHEIEASALSGVNKKFFLGRIDGDDEKHKFLYKIDENPSVSSEPGKIVFQSYFRESGGNQDHLWSTAYGKVVFEKEALFTLSKVLYEAKPVLDKLPSSRDAIYKEAYGVITS